MASKQRKGNMLPNSSSDNGIWCPEFDRIDLLALYAIMSMKRIVVDKLGLTWKRELDALVEEIKADMRRFGKNKINYRYLFYTVRDFSRVYANQWSVQELGVEIGHPLFETLVLVLCLRLGLNTLWTPNCTHFREDILIDGYLTYKPNLELTFLNQGDPLYEVLLPLCQENLRHIVLPMCDNSLFMNAAKVKSLRVLEFSTSVSDKVLCHALWNTDKKSEKLLQVIVKDKSGNHMLNPALPHLEILKSNILNKDCTNSMKLAFGAVALILQPKLRHIENVRNWSTFEAINCITEMEKRFMMRTMKSLPSVKQLRIVDSFYIDECELVEKLGCAVKMCPSLNHLIFSHRCRRLKQALTPFYKCVSHDGLENLALDISVLHSVKEFHEILNPFKNLKSLTLKISFSFLSKFYLQDECVTSNSGIFPDPNLYPICVPDLKTLSLVITTEDTSPKNGQKTVFSNSMISFLYRFSYIEDLHYYNTLELPASFVVYGCIGGAMAVMSNLKSLSIVGSNVHFPSLLSDIEQGQELSYILPQLLNDSTFDVLKKLEMFTIDEFFINTGVDQFLETLRTFNVLVRVIYRPSHMKSKNMYCSDLLKKFIDNVRRRKREFTDAMDIDLEEHAYEYW